VVVAVGATIVRRIDNHTAILTEHSDLEHHP